SGVSMGALVGAVFAREGRIDDIEHIAVNMDWKKLVGLADPHFFMLNKGFIHGEKVKKFLKAVIGDISFSDLKIPFSVVTCDIKKGVKKVINKGSVISAVRASISIPGIFTPVPLGGSFFVDGGIIEPVPVATAREMGAVRVIASNVICGPAKCGPAKKFSGSEPQNTGYAKKEVAVSSLQVLEKVIRNITDENREIIAAAADYAYKLKNKFYSQKMKVFSGMPSFFETILKAVYIMEYEAAKESCRQADVLISPDTSFMGVLEFYRGAEAIDAGYRAALNALKNTPV
ncbi:hypothetical protein FP828_06210, partial [bacterium]|nr:hypothetical protein [bacterium]